MFLKNKIILTAIIGLIASNILFAESSDEYWKKLQTKADKQFSGWDITVDVNTGFNNNDKVNGGISMKVPLYSSTDRANKEKEKLAFLEKGSKLIQLIEVNKNSLERLKKKEGWLKTLMASQGIAGINAYYDCCDEIVRKEGEIKDAERALSVMLK